MGALIDIHQNMVYNFMPRGKETIEIEEEENSELEFEVFKNRVTLTHNQLQELVYNDSISLIKAADYVSTILELIRSGIAKIKQEYYCHANVYLGEAERALEYGANCGRVIDRKLIICVLHNQACCFQKSGDCNKAVKYLEAILFNLKAHLSSLENSPNPSHIIQSVVMRLANEGSNLTFARKLELARYNLQFCSLNSQMKQRREAVSSAKAAIDLYKSFFTSLKSQYPSIEDFQYPSKEAKVKIVHSFDQFKVLEQPDLSMEEQYITITKQVVFKWLKGRSKDRCELDKYFAHYSIANLVEMDPLDYEEYQNCAHLLSGKNIIQQIIHCAMGYFQLATECRLTSEERYQTNQDDKANSQEFKNSSICHLFSIIYIGLYAPFNVLFLNQIIQSYRHHYKVDLTKGQERENQPNLSILFSSAEEREQQKNSEVKKLILTPKSKKYSDLVSHKKPSKEKRIDNRKVSGSMAKNQYFFKPENNFRKKRFKSGQSKKSSSSSHSSSYYLGNHNNGERLTLAPSPQICRSSRIISSSYVTKHESHKKEQTLDEYGTINMGRRKVSNNLRQLAQSKSKKSTRKTSTDRFTIMRKQSTQKVQTKVSPKMQKKKQSPVKAKKKKPKAEPGQAKQKLKIKKTITNYYL